MKTNELTGADLDYWTGRAVGIPAEELHIEQVQRGDYMICVHKSKRYSPSTDWSIAGPMIGENYISIERNMFGKYCISIEHNMFGDDWVSCIRTQRERTSLYSTANTPMVAVCRVMVMAMFGETTPNK